MRRLPDPLLDEAAMRLQHSLAVAPHLAGLHRTRRAVTLRPLHNEETATPKRDATARSLSSGIPPDSINR